jgi:glycosyltransferase involved in cell wall biosynthesis
VVGHLSKFQAMTIRLLMLVRDNSWYGGVVNYINALEANLSEDVHVDKLQIGQRRGEGGKWTRIFIPLLDATKLALQTRRGRYNIVHINPSLNRASLLRDALFMFVLKAGRVRGVILFIHGWEDGVAEAIENNSLLKNMFRTLFGWAPAIYVLGSRFKQTLVRWGLDARNIRVVSTMFDGKQFEGIVRKRTDDKLQLLFLSRFVKEKGIYELLQAFHSLQPRAPDIKLILAGDGPEMSRMREWVEDAELQDSVIFTGYVRDKEKGRILLDADIFVFPTYYGEGCPVSLLEAMAAGLPIISTAVGGIGDILTNGKNGYLLDEVTSYKIETAILVLLKDAKLRKNMAIYNKKIAWTNYEAAVVSKRIERVYRKVAVRG